MRADAGVGQKQTVCYTILGGAGQRRLAFGKRCLARVSDMEGDRVKVKRFLVFLVVLSWLAGCGGKPAPTPDLVATQAEVMRAAAATLTAEAPLPTAPPVSTPTAVATLAATEAATETATPVPPTATALPTSVPPTATALPTSVPPTATEPAPPIGPSLGPFAVVDVASDDQLNVRARPGVAYPIVGTIPFSGIGVEVHAGGQEVDGSWWVPVQYGEVTGWANSRYLARQVGWVDEAVAARAAQAVMALKERDLDELAGLVHPAKGVRFSPYTYVRVGPGGDLVFSAAQIPGLLADPTVYHWGVFDGSGEPIDLTFAAYYERFIYDADFARPDAVGLDETVGQGNTINNIAEVYPEGVMVEYHFEGFDPQYAGLDWRSLRLVFEAHGGTWYLVGIVHDEWTI